jgi:Trichohyalin-plectin-homology domain
MLLDDREDRILNKQVEEAEAKSIKIWHEQQHRREQLKQQVEQSRKALIEKRQAEREMERQQEREFAEYMRVRNQELDLMEANEKAEAKIREEQLHNFLKKQADQKKEKAEKEFRDEMAERDRVLAHLDENDKQFYSYAERAISEWQQAGKNIKPLIVELKNYKKRVQ